MSHSTVKLPVPAYQQRLQRMANELAGQYLPAAVQRLEQQQAAAGADAAEGSGSGSSSRDEVQLQEIQRYLYEQQQFKVPRYGRSNLPDRGKLPCCTHGSLRHAHRACAADAMRRRLPWVPAQLWWTIQACGRTPDTRTSTTCW